MENKFYLKKRNSRLIAILGILSVFTFTGCSKSDETHLQEQSIQEQSSLESPKNHVLYKHINFDGNEVKNNEDQSLRGLGGGGAMIPSLYALHSDPNTGFVDITDFALSEINKYRRRHGLRPYWKAGISRIYGAALDAFYALYYNRPHYISPGYGTVSQGSTGGGRGRYGTVKQSVAWAPRLFYREGPRGGHYQAMMRRRPRAIAAGYYAKDRNNHRIIINYY